MRRCIISSLPVSDACGRMIKERDSVFHLSVCGGGGLWEKQDRGRENIREREWGNECLSRALAHDTDEFWMMHFCELWNSLKTHNTTLIPHSILVYSAFCLIQFHCTLMPLRFCFILYTHCLIPFFTALYWSALCCHLYSILLFAQLLYCFLFTALQFWVLSSETWANYWAACERDRGR